MQETLQNIGVFGIGKLRNDKYFFQFDGSGKSGHLVPGYINLDRLYSVSLHC